jgi:hypothetical protein
VNWLQHSLGKGGPDSESWSEMLHESLNLWNVTEGTHVLTLMFFAGTIWIVDLRMMGIAFRNLPFSKINDRILPITMVSFACMIVTGVIAFFGRDPLMYYHDIWFRLKMIFLVIASVNIFWFHYVVQKNQAEWDAMEKPPVKVRLSGAISMVSWMMMIFFGRLIAYDYFHCEKVEPGSFVYVFEECKSALRYLETPADGGAPAADSAAPADGAAAPADTAAPADGAKPDAAKPDEGKPKEPAKPDKPAKPAPGKGG